MKGCGVVLGALLLVSACEGERHVPKVATAATASVVARDDDMGEAPAPTASRYEALGAQLVVQLQLDKADIALGEPMHFSFVVENASDVALAVAQGGDYRNRLGRPESFQCHATRNGQRAVVPDAGMSLGGLMGFSPLLARGRHVRRLFLPHWAVIDTPGRYQIHCAIELALRFDRDDGDRSFEPHRKLRVAATAVLDVGPRDEVALGLLIDDLGKRTLRQDDEARQALDAIHDERAITYWRQAIAGDDYGLKFAGVVALGRFRHDEALSGLKDALATQADGFANASDGVKPQLAENIRVATAQALAGSPHPAARELLLSMERDPSQGVRLTVVHALASAGTPEARARLRAIADSGDGIVSQEATRYLREASP